MSPLGYRKPWAILAGNPRSVNLSVESPLSLMKIYPREDPLFRPSAWWAVRELPGIVLCQINPRGEPLGWRAILALELSGAHIPWSSSVMNELETWWTHSLPLPEECPDSVVVSLEIIKRTAGQRFHTRKDALCALQGLRLSLAAA